MKFRIRQSLISLFVLQALVMSATTVDAAVIYSNLGPNDSFSTSPGTYPVWNLTSGGFIERAAAFTVPGSQNVQFGSADLGFHLQTGTNSAAVKLAGDASGVPGAIIESININLPAPSANPTIVTATSNTNPTLVAGSTYWIIASVNFPGTMATWGPNTTNTPGGNATRTNFQNGQWFAQPAFGQGAMRINSLMIVPEPMTMLLGVVAISALASMSRFRRPARHGEWLGVEPKASPQ